MIEQGSAEWFALRVGKVSASRISDMLAKTKSGWGSSRANYKAQLVAERLTGVVDTSGAFTSAAIEWGRTTEAEAKMAYSFETGLDVGAIDFVAHPKIVMSGASPDGLVGDDGLVEIKAPNTATHIETLLGKGVPNKYDLQMHWQMACTGRQWCDFASYDPRMPQDMRLFIRRLPRDEARIIEIEDEVVRFLGEVDLTVDALKTMYRLGVAA